MKKQFYYQRAFREMLDLDQHLIRGILSKPDLNDWCNGTDYE